MADNGQTIESLQIEVQAQATTAQTALRNLKNTLSQLKQVTKDGCGLSGVVSSLQELNSAASSINSSGAGKVIALVDAMKQLRGLGKFDPVKTFNITNFIREAGLVASMIPVDAGSKIGQLASGISFLTGIDKVKIPATLGKNLEELAASVASVPADTATKLAQIGTALNGLAGVRDIKISSTIANNLMDVAIAVEQMDTVNFDNLDKLTRGLSALNGVKISASIANNLTKLGDAADKLNGRDFSGFEKLAQSLAPITSQMNILGSTLPNISRQLGEVSVQAERLSRSNGKAKDSMVNLYAGLMLAYKGISKIATAIAKLIDKSNSFIEDYNLFNASMGKYAEEAEEYARTVGDLMGIDPGKWMRNQGVFQTLATGFGIASDRAYIMSKNLTQLGYDLSSFFNIATEGEGGSMQKLQAGLAGELEPLRRLGFDLSEARLKAVALSLGIDQTYKSMSQAEKAQLRYYAIMTQVTTAQHDMARTLDTPANQLRILKAQVEQAGRAFGNIFIPALNAVLPYAIALANALRILGETLASFFGFSLPEVDYSGIDTTLSTAADASEELDDGLKNSAKSATKLKHLLADWDELNIIQTESESGGSGKSKKNKENKTYNPEDWKWELPQYDFLQGLVKSRADAIMKQFKPALDWVKDNLENIIDLAEAVGAAFIGWKLSTKLFPGLITTDGLVQSILAGIGAVAVEFATVALNVRFTAKFLDSPEDYIEWGALFGGVITNAMGSVLFGKLLAAALGNEGAQPIATGASFILNGMVELNMAIDDMNSKGFTKQNLIVAARGILSNALGAYFITNKIVSNTFGGALKIGDKLAIGAAALALSLNVALNMGLTRDVLNDGHENIQGTLLKVGENILTDAFTAGGAGMAAKTLLGAEAGWAVTGAILSLDAAMSLYLGAEDAVANGFDWDNIATIAKGALEASAAAGMFAHLIFPGSKTAALGVAGSGIILALNAALSLTLTNAGLDEENNIGERILSLGASAISDALTVAGAGLTVEKTIGNGAGWKVSGAMLALDAAMSLTLGTEDAAAKGFDWDNIMAIAKGALEMAGSGWMYAHMLFPGSKAAGVGGVVTGLVLSLGVGLDIYASKRIAEDEDQTDWQAWLIEMLGKAVIVGGVPLVAHNALGMKYKDGLKLMGITLAISSGINLITTFGKVQKEGWNKLTLANALYNEVTAGLGLALALAAFMPGHIGLVMSISAGVITATAAITYILAVNEMNTRVDPGLNIKWGTEGLTEEQVEQKINSYFKYDVEAHIESIKVTGTMEAIRTVNQSLNKASKFIFGLRIGVNEKQSMEDMKNLLIGEDGSMGEQTLIGQMKALIHENAATITDFVSLDGLNSGDISLVGLMGKAEKDISSELTAAGELWGKYFAQGFESVASEAANNVLAYIMEIAQAATRGQREAEFNIAFGKLGLADMDKTTAGKVLQGYLETESKMLDTYKADEDAAYTALMSQYESYTAMVKNWTLAHPGETVPQEKLNRQRELAAQLFGVDAQGNLGTFEKPFEGSYAWDIQNGYARAQKIFEQDMAASRKTVADELVRVFAQADMSRLRFSSASNEQAGLASALIDYMGEEVDSSVVQTKLSEWLTALVKNSMGADFEPVETALKAGLIDIFDLFKKEDLDTILSTAGFSNDFGQVGVLKGLWESILGTEPYNAPAPDTADAKNAMDDLKDTVVADVSIVKQAIDEIGNVDLSWTFQSHSASTAAKKGGGSTGGGRFMLQLKAGGGTLNTGEMFVAREAGPELVGRIGRRTAVANNDQIVTSVSEGVANGQREQTSLLRQQNDLLRQLLNKEFSTKIIPDSQWGRFNRECERLYARNTGR